MKRSVLKWGVILIVGASAAVLLSAAKIAMTDIETAFKRDLEKLTQTAIKKVQELIDGTIYGFKVFLDKTDDGIKEIVYFYSKKDSRDWEETTISRLISEHTVPSRLLEQMKPGKKLDITDELGIQFENM